MAVLAAIFFQSSSLVYLAIALPLCSNLSTQREDPAILSFPHSARTNSALGNSFSWQAWILMSKRMGRDSRTGVRDTLKRCSRSHPVKDLFRTCLEVGSAGSPNLYSDFFSLFAAPIALLNS